MLALSACSGAAETAESPRPSASAPAPADSYGAADIKSDRLMTQLERAPVKGAVLLRQPIRLSASADEARKEPRFSKGRASVAGELWSAEVLEDQGDVVRIKNADHAPFARFLPGFEIDAYVRKTHLAPVLARPIIDTWSDGTALALDAGVPVAIEDGRLAVVDLRLDGFQLNHQHKEDLTLGFPVGAAPVSLRARGTVVRCGESGGLSKEGAPCELPGDAAVRVKDRTFSARQLGGACAAVTVATDVSGELFATFELATGPVRARVISGSPQPSRCGEAARPAATVAAPASPSPKRKARKLRAGAAVLLESGATVGAVGKAGVTVLDADENDGKLCWFAPELGHALCVAPKDAR